MAKPATLTHPGLLYKEEIPRQRKGFNWKLPVVIGGSAVLAIGLALKLPDYIKSEEVSAVHEPAPVVRTLDQSPSEEAKAILQKEFGSAYPAEKTDSVKLADKGSNLVSKKYVLDRSSHDAFIKSFLRAQEAGVKEVYLSTSPDNIDIVLEMFNGMHGEIVDQTRGVMLGKNYTVSYGNGQKVTYIVRGFKGSEKMGIRGAISE